MPALCRSSNPAAFVRARAATNGLKLIPQCTAWPPRPVARQSACGQADGASITRPAASGVPSPLPLAAAAPHCAPERPDDRLSPTTGALAVAAPPTAALPSSPPAQWAAAQQRIIDVVPQASADVVMRALCDVFSAAEAAHAAAEAAGDAAAAAAARTVMEQIAQRGEQLAGWDGGQGTLSSGSSSSGGDSWKASALTPLPGSTSAAYIIANGVAIHGGGTVRRILLTREQRADFERYAARHLAVDHARRGRQAAAEDARRARGQAAACAAALASAECAVMSAAAACGRLAAASVRAVAGQRVMMVAAIRKPDEPQLQTRVLAPELRMTPQIANNNDSGQHGQLLTVA